MAIQNKKKNHQDIHAKTYNDKNGKPQKKHRIGTISKTILLWMWGIGGAA